MALQETDGDGLSVGVDRATFLAWRDASAGLASVSAHRMSELELHGESARQVRTTVCSTNLFDTLGVLPGLGRTFMPVKEEPGAHKVIVLSSEFWQGHFAGDPAVLGRTIELDGRTYSVIGIMPPGFRYPLENVDAWVPLDLGETTGDHDLTVTARILPGGTPEQSEESLRLVPLSCGHEGRVLPLRDVLAEE